MATTRKINNKTQNIKQTQQHPNSRGKKGKQQNPDSFEKWKHQMILKHQNRRRKENQKQHNK